MAKVKFKFDIDKDLWNIWDTCNTDFSWYDHKQHVSPDLRKICEGKEFEECKDEIFEKRKKMYDSGFIEIYIEAMQKSWNKINDEYFKRFEKLMKRPLQFKEIIAYITTVTRCPYSFEENWFMISLFRANISALNTCAHEIMHIQFHKTYWDEIKKKIGEEKTADLKEALTVLNNLDFGDLWFVYDIGYDTHKSLREFIEKEWKKHNDFDILMKKCVEFLKD